MKSKQNVVVKKCKKCEKKVLFEKIDRNVQFNSMFPGNSKVFICFRVGQVAFLSEDCKILSV